MSGASRSGAFADDIARRHLLQNINIHPVLDLNGTAADVFDGPPTALTVRVQSNHVQRKKSE
jgi:hypothetical protein